MIRPVTSFRPSVTPRQNTQNNKQNGKHVAFKALLPVVGVFEDMDEMKYTIQRLYGEENNGVVTFPCHKATFRNITGELMNEPNNVRPDLTAEAKAGNLVRVLITNSDKHDQRLVTPSLNYLLERITQPVLRIPKGLSENRQVFKEYVRKNCYALINSGL